MGGGAVVFCSGIGAPVAAVPQVSFDCRRERQSGEL
jgi:hypothetical protein